MSFVELRDVKKYYKMGNSIFAAADGISFSVEKSSFTAIVGASGAGKTTILNILGGMDLCDSGTVMLDSKEISSLSQRELTEYRRQDVGFVFQFYNLVQNMTALENVELATEVCKMPFSASATLKQVGLEERVNHFPSQLSGGEMQRVAIARALAKNPKILLCDEPTGALDYKTGKSILKLLWDTCRNTGITVIMITHNQAIAAMADRVIKINSGKVVSIEDNTSPKPIDEIEW